MPNTLVHLGIQGVLSGTVRPAVDLKWVFFGCIIPDLPWIQLRALSVIAPGLDRYGLAQYAIVQASLAFCLVVSAVLALLTRRPLLVFGILGANALMHLLLDATEIKPGNGVHLLAPFSWELTSFRLFWPDHPIVYAATLLGLAVAVWVAFFARTERADISFHSPARILASLALAGVYLALPLALMTGPYEQDNHSIRTLAEVGSRVGKTVYFDRRPYYATPAGQVVRTGTGEELLVVGGQSIERGSASIAGTFIDAHTVRADVFRPHDARIRDGASYLGLTLIAILWIRALTWPSLAPLIGRARD